MAIEKRTYLDDALSLKISDVAVIESKPEVPQRLQTATTIELLSPQNKRSGKGRDAYEAKRMETFSSRTHLIEIDLLRAGKSMQVLEQVPLGDYQILIARQEQRPKADLPYL